MTFRSGFSVFCLVFGVMACAVFANNAEEGDDKKAADSKSEAKTALQFAFPGDDDITTFLKKNKCVIGSWELKKETKFGWEGNLHYACSNHRPGGVRFVEGPFKVLKPKGLKLPLNEKFTGFGNQVVLRESKQKGYHEIVAFVVPIKQVKGKQWLEGVGDLDWAGIYQKKYRFQGMTSEAVAALELEDAAKRAEAAKVLLTLGEDAVEALPVLLSRIPKEEAAAVREALVRAVATIGYGQTDKIMPTLIQLLDDNSQSVKVAAAQSIAFQGANGKAAIAALVKATAAQAREVKIEAVRALAHLGVGEPQVVEHLKKLSKGEDVALRKAAQSALQKIESDTPVER